MIARATAALLFSTLALSAPATAQECATAPCHMERGLEARTGGDDARAVQHFEAAVALERAPRNLAQLALAQQALGRWALAATHLREAMAADDPWIASHRGVLESAQSTIDEHVGQLSVTCNVEGARVQVNGRDIGTLPLPGPVSVAIGTAVIDVSADGHVPVQRQEQIGAGELSRVNVQLVARATAHGGDPGEQPSSEEATPVDPITATPPSDGDPSIFWALGGMSAGLTALALVGTVIAAVVREDHVLQWNDPSRCPPLPDGRLVPCGDVHSTWNTAEHWAIAGAVTSGVFAVLTATFFALAASDDGGSASAGLDVDVRADGARVNLRGVF